MCQRLGDRVKHWVTFNEPNVHALFGYGTGIHAPGLKGLPNALAAIHHLNLAHGRAVEALRGERADLRIGTVISLQPVRPSSNTADDHRAAERFDAIWNGACLDPLINGAYPIPVATDFAPLSADGDLATMRQSIDYLPCTSRRHRTACLAPGSAPYQLVRTLLRWVGLSMRAHSLKS
jgi:beta-glucosidase